MKKRFEQLLKLAKERKVYIQTHDYPDPDALASAYGIQYLLKTQGVEAPICYFGTVDKVNIRMMMDIFEIDAASNNGVDNVRELRERTPLHRLPDKLVAHRHRCAVIHGDALRLRV